MDPYVLECKKWKPHKTTQIGNQMNDLPVISIISI